MSQFDDYQTALNSFDTTLVGISNRKVATAGTADNALSLNGSTATDLVNTAATHTDTHANRTDNPHATTAAQIGAYSTSEVDGLVANMVPTGFLALSNFGTPDDVALPVTVDPAALTATFAAGIPAMIAGQSFTLGAATLGITTDVDNYFYLRMVAGVATIVVQTTVAAESSTNMYLGTVHVAAGVTTVNTLGKVTRIGNYRPSTTAVGSAIPVSVGDPSATGAHLQWT